MVGIQTILILLQQRGVLDWRLTAMLGSRCSREQQWQGTRAESVEQQRLGYSQIR